MVTAPGLGDRAWWLGTAPAAAAAPVDGNGHDALVADVRHIARELGLLAQYNPDSRRQRGNRGFPDLVIAGPGGVLFAEIKTDDDDTSAEQDQWAFTLSLSGNTVRLWRRADVDNGTVRAELEAIA